MKFFRSSQGEAYVAPPPAVIDPTPGKEPVAPLRTAIRPARAPQAPERAATAETGTRPAEPAARAPAAPPVAASGPRTSAPVPARPAGPAASASVASASGTTAAGSTSSGASSSGSPRSDPPAAAPSASDAPQDALAEPAEDPADKWDRRPPQPLTIASHQLAIDLARGGEPVPGLARRYPHVLNQISAVWAELPVAAEMIDDLLVDRRGGRRGFPADVLAELLTVRRVAVKRMVGLPRKPPKAPRED